MITFTQFFENQQVLNKMNGYLQQLSTNYQLIAHQTHDQTAATIMQTGFGKNGLHGTALFVNPEQIIQTASTMFGTGGQAAIHKGSNAVVVLALPRATMQQYNIRSVQDLDDHLTDLFSQRKIPMVGLPSNYVVGYFSNGQFYGNGRFNPDYKMLISQ